MEEVREPSFFPPTMHNVAASSYLYFFFHIVKYFPQVPRLHLPLRDHNRLKLSNGEGFAAFPRQSTCSVDFMWKILSAFFRPVKKSDVGSHSATCKRWIASVYEVTAAWTLMFLYCDAWCLVWLNSLSQYLPNYSHNASADSRGSCWAGEQSRNSPKGTKLSPLKASGVLDWKLYLERTQWCTYIQIYVILQTYLKKYHSGEKHLGYSLAVSYLIHTFSQTITTINKIN